MEKSEKKRIAVFANAWSEKILSDSLEGISNTAKKYDYDVFVFLSYAAIGMDADEAREEKRIYDLPDFDLFDGLIMFTSTMNFKDLVEKAVERAAKANIPLVSIGEEIDGAASVSCNTSDSMCELVEHLVSVHSVKNIEFIAGPKGNKSSECRIEAVSKVLSEHLIPFSEDKIHYTDWSIMAAMDITDDILENNPDKLPDAIICANDVLAISTCTRLDMKGVNVPEDIIVTGFDNVQVGSVFYPAITTVSQNDYVCGEKACEMLIDIIHGDDVKNIIVNNEFLPNESCGCFNNRADMNRRVEGKNRFIDNADDMRFKWSNNWISKLVLSANDLNETKQCLNDYFQTSEMFISHTMYILEDANAKTYFSNQDKLFKTSGYSDSFEVITAIENGKKIDMEIMDRRILIPGYEKKENQSRLLMFCPIHFRDWVFGYAVFDDWIEGISKGRMKVFVDSINFTVDKLKQNIALKFLNDKLQNLYVKDSLTGLYNRFGLDTEGKKIFDECKERKEQMVLLFADINCMKLINDYFGHLQGDLAIKTVAEIISGNLPKNWIAIRFGGDEFLAIGKCLNEDEAVCIQNKIMEEVKARGKELKFPYYLSVSCGHSCFVPDDENTLDAYVKITDDAMYDTKMHIHASDKELIEFEKNCKDGLSI